MNRHNIWIHLGIAVILVALAAVLGQIGRWRSALNSARETRAQRTVQKVSPAVNSKKDEVLVRFKPGVSLERIRAIAAANHDSLTDEIESVGGLAVIDDLDDADAKAVAEQYAAMSEVLYAEPNFQIKLDDPVQKEVPRDLVARNAVEHPNDPMFGDQWALNNLGQDGGQKRADLDALKAWKTTTGDHEVVVAVLDSGVDYRHPDLAENMWERPDSVPAYVDDELGAFNDLHGFDGSDRRDDPMDENGHGTHCAGIIGAEGDNGIGISGINWHVKIMPLKVLGRGGIGTADDVIEAINYVIDRKKKGVNVRIISASLGSTVYSRALEDAVRAAGDEGILVVAAAGNSGTDNDRDPHYPSSYELPNVISVAALDRNDNLASFSNFGSKSVHVAAPGKDILSTWPGNQYRYASGTSMATPYVSGVAALIVASEPRISMERLRGRLLDTADQLGALSGKVSSGGRVCAANALAAHVIKH